MLKLICAALVLVFLLGTAAQAQVRGCAAYHLPNGTAATTNSTLVMAGPRTLCDLTLVNTTATGYYLKLYDTATAPDCSSATGLRHVIPVLAMSVVQRSLSSGEAYPSGIGFCVTAGGADTNNTAAATGVFVEMSHTR